jgi:hypothetical protein
LVVDSRQGAANLVEGYFFDPHGGSLFCFLLNHTRNDFALARKMSGNFEMGRTGACDRPFAVSRAMGRQRNNWKSCDIAHLQVEVVVNVEQVIDPLRQNSIQFVSS